MEHAASQSCKKDFYIRRRFWIAFVLVLLIFFGSSCSPQKPPALLPSIPDSFTVTPIPSISAKTPFPTLQPDTPTVKPLEKTQTPVENELPSPPPTGNPTNELPVAQIGAFRSVYLRYDPVEWETFDEFHTTNPSGKRTESLRHKFIDGCVIHENFGRGAPQNWRRADTNRQIGDLVFRVEMWTDTTTHKTPLVVYQYPADEMLVRVELVVKDKPKLCIENAESIIAQSSDLIANQIGMVASPASGCNIGPRFVRFIFSYPLVDGCHACATVGEAQVAFDFDSQGKFIGKSLQ